MRKKEIFTMMIFLLMWSGTGLAGQAQIDRFVQANDAYARGNYDQALSDYTEILSSGRVSGPLFYNIGNAYFKTGDLGRAVLNYERALRYIPRDRDLQANYRYVLSQTGKAYQSRPEFLWDRVPGILTHNEFCWIFAGLIASFAALHLWGLYGRWRSLLRVLSMGIVGGLIMATIAGLQVQSQQDKSRAVILRAGPARFEPREDATAYFSLFEGELVDLIKKEKKWMKIKQFDGKTGWVQSDIIEKI